MGGLVFTLIIPLTRDQIAIVDDIDKDLSGFKWTAFYDHTTDGYYATRKVLGKHQKMHRIILSRMLGRDLLRSEQVDHIDRNSLNNRRNNLRLANNVENSRNRGIRSDNKSGYKGVSWSTRQEQWVATIGHSGGNKHLGYFDDVKEAARAYNEKALEIFGDFAVLNEI